MILELIATLGIKIILSQTITTDCQVPIKYEVSGCADIVNKTIYIDKYTKTYDKTLAHELGHHLFVEDPSSRTIIEDYSPIYIYLPLDIYETEDNAADEQVAGYFVKFTENKKKFKKEFPLLYAYFDKKVNNILKKENVKIIELPQKENKEVVIINIINIYWLDGTKNTILAGDLLFWQKYGWTVVSPKVFQ